MKTGLPINTLLKALCITACCTMLGTGTCHAQFTIRKSAAETQEPPRVFDRLPAVQPRNDYFDPAAERAKRLKLRKERNMQQAELAKLVGVRRETIGNLENGRYNPSLKLAMDIAQVFDTTVEDIFTFEDDDE